MRQAVNSKMEKNNEENSQDFLISRDKLSSLFDFDNIREAKSHKSFYELHDINGIVSGLRTSISNGISTHPKELKQRIDT